MKKLLLINIWFLFVNGSCNDVQKETSATSSDTAVNNAQQLEIQDSIVPIKGGVGNSDVKDTSKKTTKKFYPIPGGPDERKLDSLKKANDKNNPKK